MTDREKLFQEAETLGLEFKKNISTADLTELVNEAKEEKAIAAKADSYEKPVVDETVKKPAKSKAASRRAANLLKRCIVTPLEPSKQELQAEFFSVGSGQTGFIKRAVVFKEERLIPISIIRHIKSKRMSATKSRNTPKGIVHDTISVPAYNVEILPDLTESELKERGII